MDSAIDFVEDNVLEQNRPVFFHKVLAHCPSFFADRVVQFWWSRRLGFRLLNSLIQIVPAMFDAVEIGGKEDKAAGQYSWSWRRDRVLAALCWGMAMLEKEFMMELSSSE